MIPLKTCDHQLEYDIKFHKRKNHVEKKDNYSKILELLCHNPLAVNAFHQNLWPTWNLKVFTFIVYLFIGSVSKIFNTWYVHNIMHAMPCLMFLARWVCQINALSHPTLRYSIKTAGVWKSWEFLSQQSLIRDFGWEWDSLDFAHTVGPLKKVMIMVTALLPIIFIFALSIPDGLEVKFFGKQLLCQNFRIVVLLKFQSNFFLFSGLWFCRCSLQQTTKLAAKESQQWWDGTWEYITPILCPFIFGYTSTPISTFKSFYISECNQII